MTPQYLHITKAATFVESCCSAAQPARAMSRCSISAVTMLLIQPTEATLDQHADLIIDYSTSNCWSRKTIRNRDRSGYRSRHSRDMSSY